MNIFNIFQKFRGKIIGLNVALLRFDILQAKLDQLLSVTNSIASYRGGLNYYRL
jgi:hypothetical protein